MSVITDSLGQKTFKNILTGPGKLPGLSRNGSQVLVFRVLSFQVLGFQVLGLRVLGFQVLGFRVLGFQVLGLRS